MAFKAASAIRYNDAKNYPDALIRQVQALVGAGETGEWDLETVAGLSAWQAVQGLGDDGKLGPKTLQRVGYVFDEDNFHSPAQRPAPAPAPADGALPPVEVGIWFDHSIADAARKPERHIRNLVEMGISKVAIMLTAADDTEHPVFKGSIEETKKLALAFKAAGLKVVLTFWPRPRQTYLDELFSKLDEYVKQCQPWAIEPDVEGNWRSSQWKKYKEPKPFTSHPEAARALLAHMNQLKSRYGVILGATTFAEHWELDKRANASVLKHVDYVAVQCYSNWDKGAKAMGTVYAPNNFCSFGMKRAKAVGIDPAKVEMAVAAWDLEAFPDFTAAQIIVMSVRCAVDNGVRHVWFWSYKWAAGIKKNDYAFDAIKSLDKVTP